MEPIWTLKPETVRAGRTSLGTSDYLDPRCQTTICCEVDGAGQCKKSWRERHSWRCPAELDARLHRIEPRGVGFRRIGVCSLADPYFLPPKCLSPRNFNRDGESFMFSDSKDSFEESTGSVEEHTSILQNCSEENCYYFESGTESPVSIFQSSEIHSHINTLTLADAAGLNFHKISASSNILSSCTSDVNVASRKPSPLSPSLFRNIPPAIHFRAATEDVIPPLPVEVRRLLHWKLSPITPVVVRQVVVRSGFRLARKNADWIGLWGRHMKSLEFKFIKDNQKVNHFPGSHHLGRKDCLLNHLRRSRAMFKESDFNFLPDTFLLPKELKQLHRCWKASGNRQPWIVKPPASARGSGIYLIYKWSQVPKKQPSVVQRYVPNPYLINGLKFDLRVYVLVTSFNPLKIYVYRDGLVRFASVKYSSSLRTLSDKFMHLTNYSINKKNSAYVSNEDEHSLEGHKWTLRALWRYLLEKGEDVDGVWEKVIDIVVKTVVSVEGSFNHLINQNTNSTYTCFELFGFDIMMDSSLKPWLLEVNISPSLHAASNLDTSVKCPLVKDMFNIVGYHIPDRLNPATQKNILQKLGLLQMTDKLCMDEAYYCTVLTNEETQKQENFTNGQTKLSSILDELTPDDVRQLMQCEDEFARRGGFVRVFPSAGSRRYLELMLSDLYYNRLLMAWELEHYKNRDRGIRRLQMLAETDYHLKPKISILKDTCATTSADALMEDNPRMEQEIIQDMRKLGRATFKTGSKKRTGISKKILCRSLGRTQVSPPHT